MPRKRSLIESCIRFGQIRSNPESCGVFLEVRRLTESLARNKTSEIPGYWQRSGSWPVLEQKEEIEAVYAQKKRPLPALYLH